MAFKINSMSRDELKRVCKPSFKQSLFMILFDWAVILGFAFFGSHYFSWPLYLLSVVIIGSRQHGLLVLMHDGSHYRLSRSLWVNEAASELLLAWPLFIRMVGYREKHLLHHKHSNTPQDPDFRPERFLRYRRDIFKTLLRDLFLLNTPQQLTEIRRLQIKTSTTYKLLQFSFYLILISLLSYYHFWQIYLMFWIVPAFTWLKVVLRIRSLADHTGVQNREAPFDTRTIIPSFIDRVLFAPHHCSYHLVHHANGVIPCQNLKRVHESLIMDPKFVEKAHLTQGFFAFFMEFPWSEDTSKSRERGLPINLVDNMPVLSPAKL